MIKFKRVYDPKKVEQAIKEVIKQPEIVEEIKVEVKKKGRTKKDV